MPPSLTAKKSSLTAGRQGIDWIAFSAALALCALGLVTMNSFTGQDVFFVRQLVWLAVGVSVFFAASALDWRFLRRTSVVAGIFAVLVVPLIFLLLVGTAIKGARSWLTLGSLG